MYYPVSGAIAADRPELARNVQAIEVLLVDNEGSPVSLRQVEDHAQVRESVAQYVLGEFVATGNVTKLHPPLCPECDFPHEEPITDRLRCDICDREFDRRSAAVRELYLPRELDGMIHAHVVESAVHEVGSSTAVRAGAATLNVVYFAAQADSAASSDVEFREIRESVDQSPVRERIGLHFAPAAQTIDLVRFLLRHRPAVFHYSGHGSKHDGLFLPDGRGGVARLSKSALCGLLDAIRGTVKVVLLNSCYSAIEADLILQEVGILICMNDAVRNDVTIEFSRTFYAALGEAGTSVKVAFDMARAAVAAKWPSKEVVIELHARGDLDPSMINLTS